MSVPVTSLQDKLIQVLRGFERSSRYPFFRSIQLGRLLPEGCDVDPILSATTFEDLVGHLHRGELGTVFSSGIQQEALLHLLAALNEENGPSAPPLGETQSNCSVPDPAEHTETAHNSVELELELRRLLGEISSHPRREALQKTRIGDFWDAAWSPAPFEEALTVSQLASLDLSVLFRKKGVSDNRIHSLCEALKRIVASTRPAEQPSTRFVEAAKQPQQNRLFNAKMREFRDNPSIVGISVYDVLSRGQQERPYPDLVALVDAFLEALSPHECVDVVLGRSLMPALESKVSNLVKRTLPATLRELLEAFLQAPAVRTDSIASLVCGTLSHPNSFARLVATVIVRGLGASPISVKGVVYEGFWTLNPSVIKTHFERPAGALRKNILSLDPILLSLIKAQGGDGSKRKGSRNRLNPRARRGK